MQRLFHEYGICHIFTLKYRQNNITLHLHAAVFAQREAPILQRARVTVGLPSDQSALVSG